MHELKSPPGRPCCFWKGVDVRRAILAGLICNAASYVVGGGAYVLIGSVIRPEVPGPVAAILRWTPGRTFEMPAWWWVLLVVGNAVLGVAVALVYAVLYDGIPGRGVRKGLWFGFLVWLAALLPVAFTLAVVVNVSATVVALATFEPLIEYLAYGAMIAAIYGDPRARAPAAGESSPSARP